MPLPPKPSPPFDASAGQTPATTQGGLSQGGGILFPNLRHHARWVYPVPYTIDQSREGEDVLTMRTIQSECYATTFNRAKKLAKNSYGLYDCRCEYGRYTTIMGFVESESGFYEGYDASLTVSEADDYIIDHDCSCAAHRNYPGLCKHVAALALTFLESPWRFAGHHDLKADTESSPAIRALLAQHTPTANLRSYDPKLKEAPGSLELEMTLGDDYYGMCARFKIVSPTASYVLKNISEFLHRLETHEYYAYGKKMAFIHTPTLFTPQSVQVIRLMRRLAGDENPHNRRSYGFGYSSLSTGRDLYLSRADAIDLLDLYVGKPFLYDDGYTSSKKAKPASIIEADPPLPLAIKPLEGGGYEIERSKDIRVIRFDDRAYVVIGQTFYKCTPAFAPAADFLENVYCSWDVKLTVSNEDIPAFCATVLPLLEEHLMLEAPPEMHALKPEPCILQFYLDKVGQDCECKLVALYGSDKMNVLDPSTNDKIIARDLVAEANARDAVLRFLPLITPEGNARTETVEDAGRLLFGGVAELRLLGEVFTTPAFDRLATATKPTVNVGVSLEGNLINLKVKTTELDPAELGALLASYRQRRHYHRLSDGSYLSLLGTAAEDMGLDAMDRIYRSLDLTDRQLGAEGIKLPLATAFLLDEEIEDDRKDETFSQFIQNFKEMPTKKHPVPRSLSKTLRPYQREGYQWLNLLADTGLSGILADEMGLGKSLQVIAWLLHDRKALTPTPALIVCPASLVYNWCAEFAKFAPDMRVRAVSGTKDERASARADIRSEVLVTSYDSLRVDADAWSAMDLFACVLDEAQYIKNHTTKVARGVKGVKAAHRLALTGTPIENRLSELWSIFDFLMPGMLGRYTRFKERYELPIVGGDEDASARLRALVGPFILRRRKADVLTDLPDKLEQVITVQMPDEQLNLYNAHEQRLRMQLDGEGDLIISQDKIAVLAELTKLRQLCCDPRLLYENYRHEGAKLDAIVDLVTSAWEAGEKTLVFSQFTSFLDLIAARLSRADIRFYTITGSTPKRRRLDMVNQFNLDDTPAFLISLKAGGTGLNLTGASVVIHADPWWNKSAQSQATDRAHRIGQQRTVTVYQIIAGGTIEERILKLQASKAELADAVLAADNTSLGSLSSEELISLLSKG